ncbi:MAG: alpha/beta hydrolase [Microbacteriaceae bacterium]
MSAIAEAFVTHQFSAAVEPGYIPFQPYTLAPRAVEPWAIPASVTDVATSATGTPLLNQLATLNAATLTRVLEADPTIAQRLRTTPPSARAVTSWWALLTRNQRNALADSAPQIVGSLNGVPFEIRDTANRQYLTDTIATTAESKATEGRAVARTNDQRLHMLEEIRRALRPAASGQPRSLLSFDPAGAGTAAVVIGDITTASSVTFMVPGMFFTVDGQIVDWTDSTQVVHDEQGELAPSEGIATVSWMGYTTPGLFEVGSLDLANVGRDALAHTIEGLTSVRAALPPRVTIIAHSYGSTAAMMTLTEFDFFVDAFVLVGSPGGPVASAADLHVTPGNVYVGEAAWDPIPGSGFFGVKPGSAEFGATVFGVDGEGALAASVGHNGYFDRGSESVRNMALIALGQGAEVS